MSALAQQRAVDIKILPATKLHFISLKKAHTQILYENYKLPDFNNHCYFKR